MCEKAMMPLNKFKENISHDSDHPNKNGLFKCHQLYPTKWHAHRNNIKNIIKNL